MKTTTLLLTSLLCLAVTAPAQQPAAPELLTNTTFQPAQDAAPAGWTISLPEWKNAACRFRTTPEGLLVDAPQDPFAVGAVFQTVEGIEPGRACAVDVTAHIENIPDPRRSLIVRLTWTRNGIPLHPAGMLVRGPVVDADLARFTDTLVAPDNADAARLSLEVKWPGKGAVLWKHAGIRHAAPPPPRKVKVATVYLRPRNSTPEENLRLWCEQIDAAGKLALDIVCLGETITAVGTAATLDDCAEPVPGPATERLGLAARKNNIWVVASIHEESGPALYNTAVLIDRTGRLAGKYRKVHLPREELSRGVRPGTEYPVFRTDFGTIAIQICYDWFFPEPAAIFALKGAEIIFAPTWGNTLPDSDGRVDGQSVFRVRARDNAVYMVPSVYDGDSLIIDPMGRILASTSENTGLAWAEIDLEKREPLDWVGHWRSIAPRHRMPETYLPLTQDP